MYRLINVSSIAYSGVDSKSIPRIMHRRRMADLHKIPGETVSQTLNTQPCMALLDFNERCCSVSFWHTLDTLIPTTPLSISWHILCCTLCILELLHTCCYIFCCCSCCRNRLQAPPCSIGRLFVRDKQETSCRKIMSEGASAAPISPTTTDGVQGLHTSPRRLTTTTTTLAPRLEILQNRRGSAEIAFFFPAWLRITLFRLLFGVRVGEEDIDVSGAWDIPVFVCVVDWRGW